MDALGPDLAAWMTDNYGAGSSWVDLGTYAVEICRKALQTYGSNRVVCFDFVHKENRSVAGSGDVRGRSLSCQERGLRHA